AETRYRINAVIVDQLRSKRSEIGLWRSQDSDTRFAGEAARHLALRWVVRLRYGFIVGEVIIIAALALALQIPMPIVVLALVIGVQSVSNWLLSSRKEQFGENAEHLVGSLFALDTVCLTLILAFSGGPLNAFSLLYLVQITFSAIVLRKLWTWTLGTFSTVSFGLLFWVSRDVPAF